MRRAVLVAAGAGGALLAVRAYQASVAFPKAVRAAGEKIAADVRGLRELMAELDALPLTPEQRQATVAGYIAGMRARPPF